MKKELILMVSMAAFLSACSSTGSYTATHQKSSNPALMHHSEDTKGRHHFPSKRAATGNKVFIFDPNAGAWAAYDRSGNLVKTGRASGGKGYCADVGRGCKTVRGKFKVYSKKGADCKSSKFPIGEGGAPMPHCMHFHKGYAIHGSYSVPDHNASHGCIRVIPSSAKWLNENFMEIGTTVIVKNY